MNRKLSIVFFFVAVIFVVVGVALILLEIDPTPKGYDNAWVQLLSAGLILLGYIVWAMHGIWFFPGGEYSKELFWWQVDWEDKNVK